jgi:hypothetical protein
MLSSNSPTGNLPILETSERRRRRRPVEARRHKKWSGYGYIKMTGLPKKSGNQPCI